MNAAGLVVAIEQRSYMVVEASGGDALAVGKPVVRSMGSLKGDLIERSVGGAELAESSLNTGRVTHQFSPR